MSLFASEFVRRGHPDKLADQLVDAILDAYLVEDPNSRVAIEALVKGNEIVLGGEITSSASVDLTQICRRVVSEVGYTDATWGMDGNTCHVTSMLTQQSPELAKSILQESELVSGDQGIVYGFATNQTPEYLPLSYVLARRLMSELSLPFLRPDGKALCVVTDEGLKDVVVSLQHDETLTHDEVVSVVTSQVQELLAEHLTPQTQLCINRGGSFHIGGPVADSGLSGRKLMVDTYGTIANHGGGSFSGKDPTKIDRAAAYAARYIAKNLVASGKTSSAVVKLVYAIGIKDPIAISIEADRVFSLKKIKDNFPLQLQEIISTFDLQRPIYFPLSYSGHFGVNVPWEKVDKKEIF